MTEIHRGLISCELTIPSFASGACFLNVVLPDLARSSDLREKSDREMSIVWLTAPYISAGALQLLYSLRLAYPPSLVSPGRQIQISGPIQGGPRWDQLRLLLDTSFYLGLALYSLFVYLLLRRRNHHFARQVLLYEDVLRWARNLVTKDSTRVDAAPTLGRLERTLSEARVDETRQDPVIWAVLTFLSSWFLSYFLFGTLLTGLLTFYPYNFLMKNFYRHERREDEFLEQLTLLMPQQGVPFDFRKREFRIPNRNTALYLFLSLFTLGLFTIYWVYVLLKDPNKHFRHHELAEETMISQMSKLVSQPLGDELSDQKSLFP